MIITTKKLVGARVIALVYLCVAVVCVGSAGFLLLQQLFTWFQQFSVLQLLIFVVLAGGGSFWGVHAIGLWRQQKRAWVAFVIVHSLAAIGGVAAIVQNPSSSTINLRIVAVVYALMVVGYLALPSNAKHFR